MLTILNEHAQNDELEKYDIYVLFIDDNPVYIGCSSNVKSRVSSHKYSSINFNGYCVFKTFYNKSEALQFERYMIIILDLFGNINLNNHDATSRIGHIKRPQIINTF